MKKYIPTLYAVSIALLAIFIVCLLEALQKDMLHWFFFTIAGLLFIEASILTPEPNGKRH